MKAFKVSPQCCNDRVAEKGRRSREDCVPEGWYSEQALKDGIYVAGITEVAEAYRLVMFLAAKVRWIRAQERRYLARGALCPKTGFTMAVGRGNEIT